MTPKSDKMIDRVLEHQFNAYSRRDFELKTSIYADAAPKLAQAVRVALDTLRIYCQRDGQTYFAAELALNEIEKIIGDEEKK